MTGELLRAAARTHPGRVRLNNEDLPLVDAARGIFGVDRVSVAARLDDAIDQAATLAEAGGVFGEARGSGGVLITGSVVTVGEARRLLHSRRAE